MIYLWMQISTPRIFLHQESESDKPVVVNSSELAQVKAQLKFPKISM